MSKMNKLLYKKLKSIKLDFKIWHRYMCCNPVVGRWRLRMVRVYNPAKWSFRFKCNLISIPKNLKLKKLESFSQTNFCQIQFCWKCWLFNFFLSLALISWRSNISFPAIRYKKLDFISQHPQSQNIISGIATKLELAKFLPCGF